MKILRNRGFIALTAVLVLSAIFLSFSITVITHALTGSDQALSVLARDKAQFVTESCLEYALLKLPQSLNYAGNESILVGDETCEILRMIETGNSTRIIQAQSTVSGYTYRAEVVIQTISPEIVISSWEAVQNF